MNILVQMWRQPPLSNQTPRKVVRKQGAEEKQYFSREEMVVESKMSKDGLR